MLQVFVVQAFFLNLATLIHSFHGAQHTTAFADGLELAVDRLFHQVREVLDGERALPWVLILVQPQFAIDDELDSHRAAHAFFGRRG